MTDTAFDAAKRDAHLAEYMLSIPDEHRGYVASAFRYAYLHGHIDAARAFNEYLESLWKETKEC
jgi:hypothetical protein